MVVALPFTGSIVDSAHVAAVVSPAYDALTVEQRRQYRRDHPLCYLHVTRSAPDEDDATTVDNATLVSRGRMALERLLEAHVFPPSTGPTWVVYELEYDGHRQRGVVCEVPAESFAAEARPHEAVRPERVALLAEHFLTVRAASSPVACTIENGAPLAAALQRVDGTAPIIDHIGGDGLVQRVWRLDGADDHEAITAALRDADLYIIDGHHRAAANAALLEQGHGVPLLVAVFPPSSLRLAGFHRLVLSPAHAAPGAALRLIAQRFRTTELAGPTAPTRGSVIVVDGDTWVRVDFDERPISGSPLVRLGSLDPSIVEREIIGRLEVEFGAPVDVAHLSGDHPVDDVVAEARRQGRLAILVPPLDVADMIEVADGGLTMPAKSTYFTPKVRSGLFLRRYDDPGDV